MNLKEVRIKAGYNRKEAAKLLEISQIYLEMIEQGRRKPGLELSARMATLYNVSIDDVYFFAIHAYKG